MLASRLAALNRLPGGDDRELATVDDFRLASIGAWLVERPSILNTDEHPRVEFWTPRSLMSGDLLRGAWFAKFYDELLAKLPPANLDSESTSFFAGQAQVQGGRQTQRFLLFGP